MLKDEFIKMQRQDLETNKDIVLKQLLVAVEEVLKDYPDYVDLDSSLTIENCYEKMKTRAKQKAVNNSYCFAPKETKEFIIEYLGLKDIKQEDSSNTTKTNFVNLEDFI